MRSQVLFLLLCASALVHGQGRSMGVHNMVVAGDWAYFVAPPRMVTDDLVERFTVAPGGRYTMIWGSHLPGNRFAPLLDAMAGKSKPEPPRPTVRIWDMERDTLVSMPMDPDKTHPEFNQLVWSSRPGVAFQAELGDSVSDGKTTTFSNQLWKLNVADGSFKLVASEFDDVAISGQVYCSPTKPIVVVVRQTIKRAPNIDGVLSLLHVRVYDLDGKETKRADFESEGYTSLGGAWLADGSHLVGAVFKRGTGPDQRIQTTVVFDTATGALTPTSEKLAQYRAPETEADLTTVNGPVMAVSDKVEQRLNGLWLVASKPSEQSKSLVTADCDGQSMLLPDLKSVLYVSRSRLYVSEIARMDKAVYLQAKAAAERTEALSNAKQIGTAMNIYASDHNDNLPGPEGWQSAIDPYLRNSGLTNGFVYTFKGGSLNSLEDPSHTELGYFKVPGGRAVVMADSSARYIKDKP